jgi:hypothetical protein
MSLEVAAEVDWKTKREVLMKNKVARFLTFLVASIYSHSLEVVLCPPWYHLETDLVGVW